ncbi:predicted protein [Methanosarcina acetivorans C2A]|uniref:Uncharacterized protein n=1 Tax=Methanosarcina acetivorans (strain ATCC 35395 / DSM 2834 / JCM 12185 / C2A) TaxID=188937 RepID=Q8TUH3_METAC|nr:predicted protein [Methanosarcina acetivorans C2A]
MREKSCILRSEFPEQKLQFFGESPASQGILNFLRTKKEQENPDSSSKFIKDLFFPVFSLKIFFFALSTLQKLFYTNRFYCSRLFRLSDIYTIIFSWLPLSAEVFRHIFNPEYF